VSLVCYKPDSEAKMRIDSPCTVLPPSSINLLAPISIKVVTPTRQPLVSLLDGNGSTTTCRLSFVRRIAPAMNTLAPNSARNASADHPSPVASRPPTATALRLAQVILANTV